MKTAVSVSITQYMVVIVKSACQDGGRCARMIQRVMLTKNKY